MASDWGPETSSTPDDPLPDIAERLRHLQKEFLELDGEIQSDFAERLAARQPDGEPEGDDQLFASFTTYVDAAWRFLFAQRAIACWSVGSSGQTGIKQQIEQYEAALRQSNPDARIHKGSLFYNVGLCFFMSGDLDHALQYFAESSAENERSGRGQRLAALLGQDLSERVLIKPMRAWLLAECREDYKRVTGCDFDENEFAGLLNWVARSPLHAIQVLVAANRLAGVQSPPDSDGAKHLRLMGLSDLVVVVTTARFNWIGLGIVTEMLAAWLWGVPVRFLDPDSGELYRHARLYEPPGREMPRSPAAVARRFRHMFSVRFLHDERVRVEKESDRRE